MSSTILLSNTIAWAQPFFYFAPQTIGSGNEPAITSANLLLQTITGAPFKWNWNRTANSFSTIQGQQDYAVALSTFGFIEGASAAPSSGATFAIKEVKQDLTIGSDLGRPQSIAAQIDDNAGNITFRLLPVPDAVYTITVHYQQKTAILSTLTTTWTPIPDHYAYVYEYGFLALMAAYFNDTRFQVFNQKFVAHLLGAQQGLSESERNMFLDTWNLMTRQEQLVSMKNQQGRQALGT